MPKSPFTRAAEEGLNQADGRSSAGSGDKAKRKSSPTSKAKNRKKKIKKRYSSAREDAQLADVIPTTPDGAVRDERTAPTLGPALPAIVREALRENWATPDAAKPAIVASLLEPFYDEGEVVVGEDGRIAVVKPPRRMLMELAKVLILLDKTQYERDHPEEAGKARGGAGAAVNIDNKVQVNVQVGDVFSDIDTIEQRYADILGESISSDEETVRDIRANGYAESLDEAQPDEAEEEPEAD